MGFVSVKKQGEVGCHRHRMLCTCFANHQILSLCQISFYSICMRAQYIATGSAACKRNPRSSSHVVADSLFTSCMTACQTSLIPRPSHYPVFERNTFHTRILRVELGVAHFSLHVWNSSTWERNYKKRPQACSFNWGLPLCSVYLVVIHMQFLSASSMQKQKGGRGPWWWEGLGAKLIWTCFCDLCFLVAKHVQDKPYILFTSC